MGDARSFDDAFLDATRFARTVFENVLSKGEALIRARDIVNRAIEASRGAVMVLDAPVPWKETLLSSGNPKANEILFVVYPSERDGFAWQGVPDALGSYSQRKSVPEAWRGLNGDDLQLVTGVPTAVFCHPKRVYWIRKNARRCCQVRRASMRINRRSFSYLLKLCYRFGVQATGQVRAQPATRFLFCLSFFAPSRIRLALSSVLGSSEFI